MALEGNEWREKLTRTRPPRTGSGTEQSRDRLTAKRELKIQTQPARNVRTRTEHSALDAKRVRNLSFTLREKSQKKFDFGFVAEEKEGGVWRFGDKLRWKKSESE